MEENAVKALKIKKNSSCNSLRFFVYSEHEVGESGVKCLKVEPLSINA